MLNQFQIKIDANHKSRQRQVLNAVLTLATGVLTLVFPDFLYLIAGGYLISLGLMFMAFRLPSALSALPIVTGVLIFIFPDLIPITFASFLGLFGLAMLFGMQLAILGIITIIIAVLIIMNPDSVAYLIAFFMLTYSVSNLISFYKDWSKSKDDGFDDDSVTIE
ncbi:MAG: hypothetical protein CL670_01980 [Balneola sp.]|mgnify:CR=1 FL=1|jgi:hypothetical protein|nr:hypothetical protein [Balneola sp.]MBE77905.1 hypothetical protein [Balneola sp.]|tara:strand:- start:152 stop:643 length:492 start_codon:yes stop_codon:yes gene_type:complete